MNIKENWNFFLPVNIAFGRGRTAEIGELSKKYGKKALIVTGKSSAKKTGLLDRVTQSLLASGIESTLFDKAEPNPLTTTAIEGARTAIDTGADMVIALGGGSIMDSAKAIAFLAENTGDISDYIFGKLKSDRALPVIAVPTTCGTGSEGNGFAVLTNPANGDKKSLRCPAIIPKISIVDSENMRTMPPATTAAVGFDAFCHCLEAYTAVNSVPFTDSLCLSAIELLAKHLALVTENGAEESDEIYAAWDAVSAAATIGGMAIGVCGVTLAHVMEHPASGLKNIVHGKGLAALTPAVTDFTIKSLESTGERIFSAKFAAVSRILGGKNEMDLSEKIRKLLSALHLNLRLSDLGLSKSDIAWMSENCLKVSAGNLSNTCVPVGIAEIEKLYEESL